MQRPRRPRLRSLVFIAAALLVLLVVVASTVAVHAVRAPFPTLDGELSLTGLSAPVTVQRDAYGVPQVYAETLDDLFWAQGFVHAQDRFWEMDFRRHVTSGRTAELFGAELVETDTFLRTMGWRRVAEAELDRLSQQARGHLSAYAAGVNAWIEQTGGPAATGRKALQYRLLGLQHSGYQIEPWQPVDSVAWLKAMAWDLSSNLIMETERALLLAGGLSRDQVEQLYPDYPYDQRQAILVGGAVVNGEFDPTADPEGRLPDATDDRPTTGGVPTQDLAAASGAISAVNGLLRRLPPLSGSPEAGVGTNSWVVAGEHTATGEPILVNDPHLGVSVPGIWYQMGLHCECGHRVSGFSFAGLPGVVIGHNDRIAWGLSNLAHDVTDLYLELLDGDSYLVDGQWRTLEVRREIIRIAGGDQVAITTRHTHRGPLLSDVAPGLADVAGSESLVAELEGEPGSYGVSLAWTALTPGTTMEALFALNRAGDWDEFRAAARLFAVPAQNLLYADVDGNIGYQAPGRVPVRGAGDGRWIAPGWDSSYDWVDYLPFEQLPYAVNPDEGYLITANQPPVGPQYQPWLSADWTYGYRSDRIHRLLREAIATAPLTVADMESMMLDSLHPLAPTLVPYLLRAPQAPLSRAEQVALRLLAEWDFQQPADGEPGTDQARSAAAAAYFNATWRHLLALTFEELPPEAEPRGHDRWFDVVSSLLEQPDSPWWDHIATPVTETRDDILARALAEAFKELAGAQGDDPTAWRWGKMHTLTLREPAFGESGIGPVEALFNRGPVAVAGGSDAVNATAWDAATGYEVDLAPTMRMVVDLADFDRSRWVQMTGNSGHPFHPHYTDQLEPWLSGELLPWRWERASIDRHAVATLVLHPDPGR